MQTTTTETRARHSSTPTEARSAAVGAASLSISAPLLFSANFVHFLTALFDEQLFSNVKYFPRVNRLQLLRLAIFSSSFAVQSFSCLTRWVVAILAGGWILMPWWIITTYRQPSELSGTGRQSSQQNIPPRPKEYTVLGNHLSPLASGFGCCFT